MNKKIIATMLTAVCLTAENLSIIAENKPFTVTAVETQWIPQNFDDALDFYNKYGATHIEGNTICYVRNVYNSDYYTYGMEFAENSAITEYSSYNKYDYISPDDEIYDFVDFNMEVVAFELPENSSLEFTTYYQDSAGTKRNIQTYSFFSDEKGNISETDMFSWLPDCMTEYNDYIEKNGDVSVHDSNIVYCGDVNYSTGADIIFEQLGTAEVKEVYNGSISTLDIYPNPPGSTSHKIIVYQPVSDGTVKLNWTVARPWDMTYIDNENTNYFVVDENMTVTEIEEKDFVETEDPFAWLPKTIEEYNAFIEKYGNVSTHGKYIVYCDDVNYSTGAQVIMEQSGTAEIKELKHYSIDPDTSGIVVDGGKSSCVYVYEAVKSGTVKVKIAQGQPWNTASIELKDESSYEVSEDLNIKKIEEIYVKGDVNADGEFNVADVVVLQKWLLAVPDIELNNWKAADLCDDGKLDVFDLCIIKRELTK